MSTTIHYSYEYFGEKPGLISLLVALRTEFQQMAVVRVGEIIDMPNVKLEKGRSDLVCLSSSLIHSMRMHHNVHEFSSEYRDAIDRMILAECNGAGLVVDVGEGCDQFRVVLGRLQDNCVWHGTHFTKTAWSHDFEGAHETVVAMLRVCDDAGIIESVSDEGGSW